MEKAAVEGVIAEDGWRLSLESFARVASRGRGNAATHGQGRRSRWEPYRWLKPIASAITAAIRHGGGRIIVNAPPQHGKSNLCSLWCPVWYLDQYPEKKIILTSYADRLAAHWGRKVRDELAANDRCWTKLRKDMQSVTDWETTEGGGMLTAGVGGTITGRGGNVIIVDDPFKNWEEAQSAERRAKVANWFESTIYPRQQPDTTFILVQTRWHEADLTGYLLEEHADENWTVLSFPAIALEDDLIGREPGEALCPERFPLPKLQKIKAALPEPVWESLYQQHPSPPGGTIVKSAWITVLDYLPCMVDDLTRWIGSWDLTFKATGTSRVAGGVWAVLPDGRRILLDAEAERYGFLDQVDAIGRQVAKWPQLMRPGSEILVEEAANGAAVLEVLQDLLHVVPVKAHDSKDAKLMAVSPQFREGQAVALRGDWTPAWKAELSGFPFAEYDDYVDMTAQALLRYGGGQLEQSLATLAAPVTAAGLRLRRGGRYDV